MSVLLSSDQGAVRVLTLNRPEKKNAFDTALGAALWSALEAASADASVRVVVLTGAGEAFSSGADLSMFLGQLPEGGDPSRVARLHEPILACDKPILAAVQGPAVGMGVTLLPLFDMVYAAEEATFLLPFVRLGLVVEFGASFTLPRLIGQQRARELVFRAKPLDARTAESWGLVTRVFPRATLLEDVMAIAQEIAAHPPGGIRKSRKLLAVSDERRSYAEAYAAEAEVLATCYGSPENVEAVMQFLASRSSSKKP